ncbi:MAG: hypothetical protein CMJ81_16945 [Planctomycetaceae bacterium]|nr:hypothetical protein [Planctomycetaceae bacterium]MBP63319.1 hypothetical protein [Planctomycetaceae bacterium]
MSFTPTTSVLATIKTDRISKEAFRTLALRARPPEVSRVEKKQLKFLVDKPIEGKSELFFCDS